jgi:hypothetical protein
MIIRTLLMLVRSESDSRERCHSADVKAFVVNAGAWHPVSARHGGSSSGCTQGEPA